LEYLTALPEVEELDLFEVNVTGEGLHHLRSLRHLHVLSIAKCPVHTLAGLTGMTSPTELKMWGLQDENYRPTLTDEGTVVLATLTALEKLSLRDAAITDVTLARLAELTKLRSLDLSQVAGISNAGLAALANLKDLRTLRLAFVDWVPVDRGGREGPITDDGLWYLAGLSRLAVLDLEGQPITDSGLAALRGLVSLRRLNLKGTHVTPRGIAELLALLPNVKEGELPRSIE